MSTHVDRPRVFINALLVYLLLFVGGTWRYNVSPDKYLIVAFLISFIAWFLLSDRKIGESFLIYIVVLTSFLFFMSLYTGGSVSIQSVISSAIKLLLAYFIIKTVGKRFADTYITVVTFLAAFSLFGYLSDSYDLLDGLVRRFPLVGDMGYEGILYLYRFDRHIDRNNSIFYEPGAYQGFLNAALFLVLFAKTRLSTSRRWGYSIVLIVALATTYSTTGFLIFSVMFVVFFYKSKMLTASQKIKLAGLAVVAASIFATHYYSTVVVKMNEYLTAHEYEYGTSAKVRSLHAKTDMKLFKEHVFGMGHKEYREAFITAARNPKERTSSNGVTKMLAVFGLPFSLFIFGSYFWALKTMLRDYLLASIAFVMFMMFLAGESYYMLSPISYAIIASAFIFKQMSQKAEDSQPSMIKG